MFTWICPQCGREVPPSYTECPDCAERQKTAGAAAAAAAPVAAPAQTPVQAAPPPAVAAAPKSGVALPTWLMSIIFAAAFIGIGMGVYWTVQHFKATPGQAAPKIALEDPAAQRNAAAHPLQRYIEVAGVRFVLNARKNTEARFLVINHSDAEITDLAGNVIIWGKMVKAGEESVGTIPFKVHTLAPNDAKEVSAPLSSKLKIYELPDWQNVVTELRITAP